MINVKNFDIYYIGYFKKILHWILQKNISDYESIHSANPLYFITGEVDGYIKKKVETST